MSALGGQVSPCGKSMCCPGKGRNGGRVFQVCPGRLPLCHPCPQLGAPSPSRRPGVVSFSSFTTSTWTSSVVWTRFLSFSRGLRAGGWGTQVSLGSSLGNTIFFFPSESGYLKSRAEVGADPGNGAPRTCNPPTRAASPTCVEVGRCSRKSGHPSDACGSLADRIGIFRRILFPGKGKRFQNHFKLNYFATL